MLPSMPVPVSDLDTTLMDAFCQTLGFSAPLHPDVQAANRIGTLVHWRLVSPLLGELTPLDAEAFRRGSVMVNAGGYPCDAAGACTAGSITSGVDSHFHLDRLLDSWERSSLPRMDGESLQLSRLVSNFCYPPKWPSLSRHQQFLGDQRLAFAYGIHPRSAARSTPKDVARLRGLLSRGRVVALGEIGLDFTDHGRSAQAQMNLLEEMLPLAVEFGLPVIIHCRDGDRVSAGEDCRDILGEHLPKLHPIHLHCYSGGLEEFHLWQEAFPNLCFGFTATLLREPRHPELEDVVRQVPAGKLLLETDAPYLVPPRFRRSSRFCHPWMLSEVAARVASLKGVPVSAVIEASAVCAARLYRL